MNGIDIRYESTYYSNALKRPSYGEGFLQAFCFRPFELGLRHLNVAFCSGSQDALTLMAKERIIYRASENNHNQFPSLTPGRRIYHLTLGLLETLGYLTVIVPIIVGFADHLINCRRVILTNRNCSKTDLEEGGNWNGQDNEKLQRRNPFSTKAINDSFYQGAYWLNR